MTSRIAIQNMQFHGFHGCLPEEAVIGTTYTVCVEFVFDIKTAAHNDSLEDTIDYGEVFDICKTVMLQRQKLIETVACKMFESLKNRFVMAQSIQLKLCKWHPPINGPVEQACIILNT